MNAARRVLYATAAATAAVVLMAGCSATPLEAGDSTADGAPARQLEPDAFAMEIASGTRFVINVHIPDEGRIDGTDADIPFNQIDERAAELPQDTSSAIAVYCMTGGMSAAAVETLANLGYVDVVELRGGMAAWESDGLPLIEPTASGMRGESGQES